MAARNALDTAKAQLEKATKHQDLVRLTANEDLVVLTQAKLSVGSVLKEGDSLFTLMPTDTPLEAELRIASRDVGFLRRGDRCELKIDAFNFIEHGTAEGKVSWISEGAFTTDDNGQPLDALLQGALHHRHDEIPQCAGKLSADPGHDFNRGYEHRHPLRGGVSAVRLRAR